MNAEATLPVTDEISFPAEPAGNPKPALVSNLKMFTGTEAGWVMFGQGLFALGSVFGIAALTKWLDPSEYGNLALALTIVSCTQQPIFGPLSMGAMRYYSVAATKEQLPAFLSGILHLTAIPMGIIAILGLAVRLGAHGAKWSSALAVLPALLYALVSGLNNVADGMQSAARQRSLVALQQGVGQWLRIGVAIAFLVLWQRSVSAVIYGFALASCFVYIPQFLGIRKLIDIRAAVSVPSSETSFWKKSVLNYSAPFALWGAFAWLQIAAERWALKLFSSSASVGLYAVAFQLGYYPITVIAGALVLMIAPILYARAGDGSDAHHMALARNSALRLAAGILGASLVLTVAAWAISGRLFNLLTPLKYHPAGAYFPVLLFCGGLFTAAEIVALRSHLRLNPRALLKPKIGTALVAIVLAVAGAYWFELRGVVYARLLSSILYLLWTVHATSDSPTYANVSNRLQRAMWHGNHAARTQLKRINAVYAWNARRRAAATARSRNALIERYRIRVDALPTPYSEANVLNILGERIATKYAVTPKPRGSLRIFWVGADESQDNTGFLQSLATFGEVVTLRQDNGTYGLEIRTAGDRRALDSDLVRRNAALLYDRVSAAHKERPIDLILGQMWAYMLDASGLQAVQALGIPTAAVAMDDRLPELWNDSTGPMPGCGGLVAGLDLVLTSSPECCEWYWADNMLALYWPMASNSEVYFPKPEKKFDVTFVGSRYGFRSRLIDHLSRAGIAVNAFGPGWPAGAVKANEIADIFGQSKIILGSGFVAYSEDVKTLKLRDFDAPMSGAMYITHRNPDLLELFKEGEEIECYDSIEECEQKLRIYLADPVRRQGIAEAGFRRAKENHTWDARFEFAFRALRILS